MHLIHVFLCWSIFFFFFLVVFCCACLCRRDPVWFSEGWQARIKTDVADNWRLKVEIPTLWSLCSPPRPRALQSYFTVIDLFALRKLVMSSPAASSIPHLSEFWWCNCFGYLKQIEMFKSVCPQMNNLKKILQLVVDYYNEVCFMH